MREECRAAICRVLAGRNVKELKRLFNSAHRKAPFGELLGWTYPSFVDTTRSWLEARSKASGLTPPMWL
jgi:hypothetical protein